MTRHSAIAALTLLGAAALTAACRDTTGPGDPLQVTVAASSATVSPGAPLTITITVVNPSATHARQLFNTDCGPSFDVVDDDGSVVGPPGRMCSLALNPPVMIGPGESYTLHETWNGRGGSRDALEEIPLSPGSYRLVGRVVADRYRALYAYLSGPLPVEVIEE